MTNITEGELLQALEQYQQQDKAPQDGSFTSKEFSAIVEVNHKKALRLIKGMLLAGLIEHCPTTRENIIGQPYVEKYAWRLKKQELKNDI